MISDQIDEKLDFFEGEDIKLDRQQILSIFTSQFIESQIKVEKYGSNNVPYINYDGKRVYFLLKNVTYLGNPHPLYKKRIQLSKWYPNFVSQKHKEGHRVHIWGIYSTKSSFINVDFEIDGYINGKFNNSSAHVAVNDLYIGFREGYFSKKDKFNNKINIIAIENIEEYLSLKYNENHKYDLVQESSKYHVFGDFHKFNLTLGFGEWINSGTAIRTMHKEKSVNWKQTEWAGWYLEHKFEIYCRTHISKSNIIYLDGKMNNDHTLDFDLWFERNNHYGDLKASSIDVNSVLLNDKNSVDKAIQDFGKIWYVIYEHETILDRNVGTDFLATKDRNTYINENAVNSKLNDLYSYKKKMKNKIKFKKMIIIEVNKVNIDYLFDDFAQGRQATGTARELKYMMKKRNIENFTIYSDEVS